MSAPDHSELESFAKFIGLTGSDYDLFYETYYNLDNDAFEEELEQDIEDLIESHYVS